MENDDTNCHSNAAVTNLLVLSDKDVNHRCVCEKARSDNCLSGWRHSRGKKENKVFSGKVTSKHVGSKRDTTYRSANQGDIFVQPEGACLRKITNNCPLPGVNNTSLLVSNLHKLKFHQEHISLYTKLFASTKAAEKEAARHDPYLPKAGDVKALGKRLQILELLSMDFRKREEKRVSDKLPPGISNPSLQFPWSSCSSATKHFVTGRYKEKTSDDKPDNLFGQLSEIRAQAMRKRNPILFNDLILHKDKRLFSSLPVKTRKTALHCLNSRKPVLTKCGTVKEHGYMLSGKLDIPNENIWQKIEQMPLCGLNIHRCLPPMEDNITFGTSRDITEKLSPMTQNTINTVVTCYEDTKVKE